MISVTLALFIPFYSEILLAAVFSLAIVPTLGKWLQARHLRWKISVAGILALMFLLIAGPITLLSYKAYLHVLEISKTGFQNTDLFQKLAGFRDQLLLHVNNGLQSMHLENKFDLGGMSEDGLRDLGTFVMGLSTRIVYHIPELLLSVFVFNLALYFFLVEAQSIKKGFVKAKFLTETTTNKVIDIFQKSSFNTVVTSLALGGLSSLAVAMGAVFMDSGEFLVIFFITFFCSFIPVIGAGPVALVLGLFNLVMGNVGHAIGFLIVAVVVGLIDNGLRPYMISSNDEDLHPVVSLLALIGALLIFGMPGIFLGPVIAGATVKLIPVFYPHPAPPTEALSGPDQKGS